MFRSSLRTCSGVALAALAFVSAPSTGSAQSWEISDEIAFAENLARYRMFDLSAEYLEELANGDLEADDRLSLLYARALLQKIAGEYAEGDENRLAFLDEAGKGYADYLNRADDNHDKYNTAQSEAAQVQRALGALFATQIARGDADPELKSKAEGAFRDSIERLNKELNRLRKAYEDLDRSEMPPEEQQRRLVDAYRPMMDLASTYYEFAQLYSEGEFNREDYLNKAAETSEDFLWEVGSDSFPSMQAYYWAGRAYIGLGDWDEGLSRLNFVIDKNTGFPAWFEGDEPAPDSWLGPITVEMEKVYLAIAEAANSEGKYDVAESYLEQLEDWYTRFSSRGGAMGPNGELCRIERARAMHSQGNPEGMKLLQKIAGDNAQNTIGAKAAEMIAQLLGGDGGGVAMIPATIWFTAGQAAHQEDNFHEALDNYHKALAAVDATISDPAKHKEISIGSWKAIGDLYRYDKRLIEASIAYEEGLKYRGDADIDKEDQKTLGSALFNTLQARFKETKSREDQRAKDKVQGDLANMGLDEMGFLIAKDDFERARLIPEAKADEKADAFKNAIRGLKEVKKSEKSYERALILIARAEGEQGNFKEAIKLLDAFFKRIADPKNEIPTIERAKRQSRDIASTEATFYKATYLAKTDKPADVLTTLEKFEEKFPTQTKFFPNVNFMRLRAHLTVEPPQVPEAEALYAAKTAEGTLPSEAQYFLARALLDKAASLDESNPEEAKTLRTKGAQYMYEYCEGTGFASYANLKVAGDNFRALEQFADAEKVYIRLMDTFGNDANYRDRVSTTVKRQLADMLLAQDKFQEAAPLYKELLASMAQDLALMKQAARAFGGRVDVRNGTAVEIPGAGYYEEAVKLWDDIAERGYTRETRFQGDWWEAKYYTIYTRYRAKELGPEWANNAKRLLRNLETNVLGLYPRDEWADVIGGKEWLTRYTYLQRVLK